ncbi:unnamed protein product [Prunus armeniaca]
MCIYCTMLNELYIAHTHHLLRYNLMDKAMRIVSVFRFLSIATITTISLCNGNLGVPCEQNERQALLMFKQDLKDPSNRLLSWVGEGDCCSWTGVVCDNLTGHVRELHLGNYYSDEYLNYSLYQENSLGGKIPSFLGSLKSLRYLNLSDSKFAGIIQHQLGNLSSLRSLGLRSKSYYVLDEVGVANMTRLKVVNLRWNIIWGTIPQWLYACSNLESLSLYLNLLQGEISSSTGNLKAIVNLDLSANQIEGKMPNSLRNLCKLTVLDLSRNYFNRSVSEILGSLSGCNSGQMESLKQMIFQVHYPISWEISDIYASLLFRVIQYQIFELNLSSGIEELESLIGSTLSSDITLFEKISSSAYRVRINSSEKKVEESQSNTEDSEAVDDDLGDSGTCSSDDDDSGCNLGNSKIKKLTYMNHGKSKDNMVIV